MSFTLNGHNCINKKRLPSLANEFPVEPARVSAIGTEALSSLEANAIHMRPRIQALEQLVVETRTLCKARFPEM